MTSSAAGESGFRALLLSRIEKQQLHWTQALGQTADRVQKIWREIFKKISSARWLCIFLLIRHAQLP